MEAIKKLIESFLTVMPLSVLLVVAVGIISFLIMIILFIIGTGNPIP